MRIIELLERYGLTETEFRNLVGHRTAPSEAPQESLLRRVSRILSARQSVYQPSGRDSRRGN
jgi:hypothetical protein